jgi:hypothetical protein
LPQDREIEAGSSSRGAAGARLAIGLSALFAAALALRLTLLWETWRSRFTPAVYLPIDARDYHLWALQWLRGEWPPAEPFFRPPLYPLFLGSTYALFGASPLGPLVVQALLGAASCLLAFGIARELFEDRRVAWLAGAARPADWLRLIGSKLVEVVNGVEIGRNTSPYADRRDSVVLRLLLWREAVAFPTGLLVPLGFAGIALCRRAWRLHLIVWAALATQVVFLLAFFVASRYRLPMLPLLAIYSAHAGVTLVDRIRRDEGAAAGRLAGGIALLALIANVRAVPAPDRHHFVDHFNLAVAYRDRGDFATAAAEFRTALALDPEDPKLLQALCEVLSVGEPGQEAVAVCTRAAGFDPASAALQYRAGQALEASGRLVEAAWKRARAAGASADSGGP